MVCIMMLGPGHSESVGFGHLRVVDRDRRPLEHQQGHELVLGLHFCRVTNSPTDGQRYGRIIWRRHRVEGVVAVRSRDRILGGREIRNWM